jgi:hypothetical protein
LEEADKALAGILPTFPRQLASCVDCSGDCSSFVRTCVNPTATALSGAGNVLLSYDLAPGLLRLKAGERLRHRPPDDLLDLPLEG